MNRRQRFGVLSLILALMIVGGSALAVGPLRLPSSVQTIEEEAFEGTQSLDEVVLPDGVKKIGDSAFADSSMATINLPDSLDFIADSALDGPEKVHVLANPGSYAFGWAVDNGYLSLPDNYPQSEHPYAPDSDISWEYVHPEPAAALAVTFSAMTQTEEDCDFLTVTDSAGASVRYDGDRLAGMTLVLPGNTFRLRLESDDSIERYGFAVTRIRAYSEEEYAAELEERARHPFITREMPDGKLEITGYRGLGGQVEIPAEIDGAPVTSIGYQAFKGIESITGVAISDGVTHISGGAFMKCLNLQSAAIPGSVETIGSNAFEKCAKLSTLTLSEGIEEILWDAFCDCEALEEVTLPSSLRNIANTAFWRCHNLKTVHAEKYTYAYAWAVDMDLIHPEGALEVVPMLYDGDVAERDDGILWQHLDGDESCIEFTIHAEEAWTAVSSESWLTLEGDDDGTGIEAEPGDTTLEVYTSMNLTGATREATVTFTSGEATFKATLCQLPRLQPELITPSGLVELYSAEEVPENYLTYGDLNFTWKPVPGTVKYEACLEVPGDYNGSDGIEYTDTYTDEDDLSFFASIGRLQPTLETDHDFYLRCTDAYGHTYTSRYNFGLVDQEYPGWGYFHKATGEGQEEYEISLCNYVGNDAAVVVPATIRGWPVRRLWNTFYGNERMTSVTIPQSVTEISDYAFEDCDNLTEFNAVEGSYAYEWGVAHGYIPNEEG